MKRRLVCTTELHPGHSSTSDKVVYVFFFFFLSVQYVHPFCFHVFNYFGTTDSNINGEGFFKREPVRTGHSFKKWLNMHKNRLNETEFEEINKTEKFCCFSVYRNVYFTFFLPPSLQETTNHFEYTYIGIRSSRYSRETVILKAIKEKSVFFPRFFRSLS